MSFIVVCLVYCVVGRAGQPAAQLLEQSLSADSTSITLKALQPDTEYVISLYPLFPRNSASPSILNARTCKFTLRCIINVLYSYLMIVNVFNLIKDY